MPTKKDAAVRANLTLLTTRPADWYRTGRPVERCSVGNYSTIIHPKKYYVKHRRWVLGRLNARRGSIRTSRLVSRSIILFWIIRSTAIKEKLETMQSRSMSHPWPGWILISLKILPIYPIHSRGPWSISNQKWGRIIKVSMSAPRWLFHLLITITKEARIKKWGKYNANKSIALPIRDKQTRSIWIKKDIFLDTTARKRTTPKSSVHWQIQQQIKMYRLTSNVIG